MVLSVGDTWPRPLVWRRLERGDLSLHKRSESLEKTATVLHSSSDPNHQKPHICWILKMCYKWQMFLVDITLTWLNNLGVSDHGWWFLFRLCMSPAVAWSWIRRECKRSRWNDAIDVGFPCGLPRASDASAWLLGKRQARERWPRKNLGSLDRQTHRTIALPQGKMTTV